MSCYNRTKSEACHIYTASMCLDGDNRKLSALKEDLPSSVSIMSCTMNDTYCLCEDNSIWRWKNNCQIPKQLIFQEFSSM